MSVQPLEDVLSDFEYEEPCYRNCTDAATWLVWVSHARNGGEETSHREHCVHSCEVHRKFIEGQVLLALNAKTCFCGFCYSGQLSDHYRAIKL